MLILNMWRILLMLVYTYKLIDVIRHGSASLIIMIILGGYFVIIYPIGKMFREYSEKTNCKSPKSWVGNVVQTIGAICLILTGWMG